MNSILETLLRETFQEIDARRRLPESTYRLQFHAGFTFRDAAGIVPYLRQLGVTHCYASPYLKARAGSTHGYDISDHRVLNPEVGTEEDFAGFTDALHEQGMGQLVDTVPNHMGIMGNENLWWRDVLENGPASPYASTFDISWYASPRPELHGKVLLPVLGDPYGKVLESQQLKLEYGGGAFSISYYDLRLPVAPRSYGLILVHTHAELSTLDQNTPVLQELLSILTAVKNLPPRHETDPAKLTERIREKEIIKRRLAALTQESKDVQDALERTLAKINGRADDPSSFNLLDELLNDQAYRLSYWRVASDEINYRRFFDINELAALSMEREEVFSATHELILRLLQENKIDGLRIDHPDGLYDPKQYLYRLQEAFVLAMARRVFASRPAYQGSEWEAIEPTLRDAIARAVGPGQGGQPRPLLYVVVEKILVGSEPLPPDWPVYGTTGYDFLSAVGGVFVDSNHAKAFSEIYQDWVDDDRDFDEIAYQKKFVILQSSLSSELHMLGHELDRLAQRDRWSRDFTANSLRHALRHVLACFPAYRSYIADEGVKESDRRHILRAIKLARPRNPSLSPDLFNFIRDMLLLKPRPGLAAEGFQEEQRRFAGKFQQVTSPVTAKGMEDTAFYVYNRLLSLNEVGGDPSRFGQAPAGLHRWLQERQAKYPYALSTTSTHDTKRSEDVRARLHVLSELPEEWASCLSRWSRLNDRHRAPVDDARAPDNNEEYLIYQTLLGAWPLEPYTAAEFGEFTARVQAFMRKALHEAKVHTSWINPNPGYDEAVQQFVARILDPAQSGEFIDELRALQRRLSHFGLFNSLSQTLVKLCAPGVPDTYQGTELWDFSLADPDNRRPVDFERRCRLLTELKARSGADDLRGLAEELTRGKEDGRIKLYVTWRTLESRREHPGLFSEGEYLPLQLDGPHHEHAMAFMRRGDTHRALVVVPRLLTRLVQAEQAPLGADIWQDTAVLLPGGEALHFVNRFTGEQVKATERIPLAKLFASFPVALLMTPSQGRTTPV